MTERARVAPAVAGAWDPYVPNKTAPWNLRRVVHLHRRAGFAATWAEVRRDLADGPRASIDRLIQGKGGHPDASFERTAKVLADAAAGSRDAGRLKAWWVFRMLHSPDPLAERLTLLWHNHFATSNQKVDDLAALRRQNDLFRRHARAPFGELLVAVVKDPALLLYLDAPANRKGHPNENLARELMELFTLGIGNYTEKDVKEAARALTGWSVEEDAFKEEVVRHDGGEKTILGRRGRFRGNDLVKILLEHPATARRLAFRIVETFLGEELPGARALEALAQGLRERRLDVGWAVETVLRSRAFFAEANLRRRALGPAEFVVGAVRALEQTDSAGTLELAGWLARLGQDLFYPPNVGGWPGGRHWLSTQALMARVQFAFRLVRGKPGAPLDVLGLARRHGVDRGREALVDFFTRLLLGTEPTAAWRRRLEAGLPATGAAADVARRVVALILASPEAQVG
jgi:uncharacterized protein (DUF1800 family)